MDLLFRALHNESLYVPRQALLLNTPTHELFVLWETALLNPVDFRNTVLWAALLPGLVAVPVLALRCSCCAWGLLRCGPACRGCALTS